ncbi:hypothetical protein F4782DRAFT_287176 [Xylaria castorea]|nr:hypothetical protein F4782DRAFT_287176 [Xylaria castorea]
MPYQTSSRTKQKPAIETTAGATTFNSLPTEIRLMIWEEFVRIPRIIHIDIRGHENKAGRGFDCRFESCTYGGSGIKSEQVCPLVGVNHESRCVALKEPLMHFDIRAPVSKRKRFQKERTVRFFAVRSHDILFFGGSESWALWYFLGSGQAKNIANIMIDLDVRLINYQKAKATPNWRALFDTGATLTGRIHNRECLKNFYCLTWNPTINEERHFELDDLRGLTPEQFPGYRKDLERWLEEFRSFLGTCPESSEYFKTLREVWRNVTVEI